MARMMYPIDVPLGARIVLEGILVEDVAMWSSDNGPVTAILGNDGMTRLYDPAVQIEVEEDTLARRERLAFAEKILRGDDFLL